MIEPISTPSPKATEAKSEGFMVKVTYLEPNPKRYLLLKQN